MKRSPNTACERALAAHLTSGEPGYSKNPDAWRWFDGPLLFDLDRLLELLDFSSARSLFAFSYFIFNGITFV
jgi:hypothetical protein